MGNQVFEIIEKHKQNCADISRSVSEKYKKGMLTSSEACLTREREMRREAREMLREIKEHEEKSGKVVSNEDNLAKYILMESAGLKEIEAELKTADTGFDHLIDGGIYTFRNALKDVDELVSNTDRDKKEFHMTLFLPKENEKAEVPFRFIPFENSKRKNLLNGIILYMGYSYFNGYGGECSIWIREQEKHFFADIVMKTDVQKDDPVWSVGPFRTVKVYTCANIEE